MPTSNFILEILFIIIHSDCCWAWIKFSNVTIWVFQLQCFTVSAFMEGTVCDAWGQCDDVVDECELAESEAD